MSAQTFSYEAYDRLLKKVVDKNGMVDYASLQSKYNTDLKKIVAQFASVSPDSKKDVFKTENEKLAYWLNAYNVSILNLIAEEYPTKSIKDIYGALGVGGELVWVKKRHILGGEEYSFNNIEHDIIRKRFKEPRIHFAVNCASMGCPLLQDYAFLPNKLEEQFQEAMRDFYKSELHFKIDDKEKKLYVTKIFDWFSEDFYSDDKEEVALYDFLIANAEYEKLKRKLESIKGVYDIEYLEYSWDLNDQKAFGTN